MVLWINNDSEEWCQKKVLCAFEPSAHLSCGVLREPGGTISTVDIGRILLLLLEDYARI